MSKKYPQVILINIDNFNRFKTNKLIIEFKLRDEEGNIENNLYYSIHLVLDNINNPKYNINKEIRKFGEFLKKNNVKEMEVSYKGDKRYMATIRTVEDLTTDPEMIGYYDYEEVKKKRFRGCKRICYRER